MKPHRDWPGELILEARWLLYPTNAALIVALLVYVAAYLQSAVLFVVAGHFEMESLMLQLLGFVDASMVANLVLMIAQGSHQIFIRKLPVEDADRPQYLDHIDSSILKIKMAMSIAGITLVRVLKDFVDLERVGWELVMHRLVIHGVALASALVMAVIWRLLKGDPHARNGNH